MENKLRGKLMASFTRSKQNSSLASFNSDSNKTPISPMKKQLKKKFTL
jgi:hypothetical protein